MATFKSRFASLLSFLITCFGLTLLMQTNTWLVCVFPIILFQVF